MITTESLVSTSNLLASPLHEKGLSSAGGPRSQLFAKQFAALDAFMQARPRFCLIRSDNHIFRLYSRRILPQARTAKRRRCRSPDCLDWGTYRLPRRRHDRGTLCKRPRPCQMRTRCSTLRRPTPSGGRATWSRRLHVAVDGVTAWCLAPATRFKGLVPRAGEARRRTGARPGRLAVYSSKYAQKPRDGMGEGNVVTNLLADLYNGATIVLIYDRRSSFYFKIWYTRNTNTSPQNASLSGAYSSTQAQYGLFAPVGLDSVQRA